jgi:hypothetical protein
LFNPPGRLYRVPTLSSVLNPPTPRSYVPNKKDQEKKRRDKDIAEEQTSNRKKV